MRDDHRYYREDGVLVPVRDMTLDEISRCLIDGVAPDSGEDPADVLLRLEIELIIRSAKL